MNKLTKTMIGAGLICTAGVAGAQTVNTSVQNDTSANLAETAMIKSDTSVNAGVDADMMKKSDDMMKKMESTATNISEEVEQTFEAGVDSALEVAGDVEAGVEAGVDTMKDAMIKSESDASISAQVSLSSNALRAENSMRIESSSEVNSEAEFKSYAMTQAGINSNITMIESNDSYVKVDYTVPVKLFGFISMDMKQTATVTKDSNSKMNVKVEKAWWGFLATGDDTTTVSSTIEVATSNMNSNTTLEARAQAEVLEAIAASIKMNTSANVSNQ